MNEGMILMAAGVCLSAAVLLFIYSGYRQRHLTNRLHRMLKDAQEGSFREQEYDETTLSSLEARMAGYLSANQLTTIHRKEQQEQIQRLISDISHQTKMPLSNLKIYSELLSEMELPQEAVCAVEAIRKQTDKLEFLLQALVKMSRLENGILQVQPEKQLVGSLIDQAYEEILQKAAQKDIQISYIRDHHNQAAWFDRKWTLEALNNLLDNAVKYTPKGGKITIEVQVFQLFLRIDVKDNGIGIAEEELAKIFTRFYRGTAVSGQEGVGVGLYLAREIAAKEGGYIRVLSKWGKGSTFSLYLPC